MSYEEALAAFRRGEDERAADLAARALASAGRDNDLPAQIDALCMLARVALRRGDLAEVAARADEAQALAHTTGDARAGRMPLHLRAVAARMEGRYDEARARYLDSIALNESLGERGMAAAEHRNLAYVELRAGDDGRARELFAAASSRFGEIDAPALAPYLTVDRATLAALDGDLDAAATHLHSALEQFQANDEVPDPDDASEIARLTELLAARS